MTIVIACRAKLMAFRRECKKAFPSEHLGILRGKRTDTGVLIEDIVDIPHLGDPDKIDVEPRDLIHSKISALFNGAEFLGTIHSHCNVEGDPACWHLSKTDIKGALKDGETVCGIVYVDEEGSKSEVHWYIPHPIPTVSFQD